MRTKVGSLGLLYFDEGLYAYVGSAQNSLENRVRRHRSKNKKIHWHIDYLLKSRNTKIKDVFYKKAEKIDECKTAKILKKNAESYISRFGCSDCKCSSHLFRIDKVDFLVKSGWKKF